MSVEDQRQRYYDHNGKLWFVVDTQTDGEHSRGRLVAGPMDGDSAERAAHEMNDHCDGSRYLASQKLSDVHVHCPGCDKRIAPVYTWKHHGFGEHDVFECTCGFEGHPSEYVNAPENIPEPA